MRPSEPSCSSPGVNDVCLVYVTAPPDQASTLARALVERRVCACCNILPVSSVFRWDGAIQEESEALLIIKTTADRFEALREAVLALHPYDVPEVIAASVSDGHPPYMDWVRGEVG